MDEFGSTIVHAPQDSGLQVTATAPTIHSYGFLDLEDTNSYVSPVADFKVIDTDKEDIFAKYTLDGEEMN